MSCHLKSGCIENGDKMEAESEGRTKELQKEKMLSFLRIIMWTAPQEIADYVGDSFYLSKVVWMKVPQKMILFAGVTFML